MAIDFSNLMQQLKPAAPLNFGNWNRSGESSTARDNLALMREKFDWEKKRAAELDKQKKEEAAAAAAAAKLASEEEKAAKLLEKRQATAAKFSELNGQGKFEEALALAPYMSELGSRVTDLGSVNGMPTYQIDLDAAAADKAEAERMAQASPYDADVPEGAYGSMEEGMGAPASSESAVQSLNRLGALGLSGEMGALNEPVGIRSSDEVDPVTGQSVSDRVMAAIDNPTDRPMRGPDEEDYTGGVQRNVLDTGANYAQTLKRLDPMMSGLASAMPDPASRAVADSTRQALRHSGLPLDQQLDAYNKSINEPLSVLNAQTISKAKQDENLNPTPTTISTWGERGRDSAETLATKNQVVDAATSLELADQVMDILNDPLGGNDTMIGGALLKMQAVKGDPSDRELQSAFGADKLSYMDELLSFIHEKSKTGFSPLQKEALESYIQRTAERMRGKVFDFLDSADRLGDSYNEYEKRGYRDRANQLVPEQWRAEWEEDRKERQKKRPGGATTTPAGTTASGQGAELGAAIEKIASDLKLSVEGFKSVVAGESGGAASAVNPDTGKHGGLIQFSKDTWDSVAKMVGTPDVTWDDMLKLSPEEQLPYAAAYFKSMGLTEKDDAGEYAMATFMPKYRKEADDFVLGEKGSKEIAFGKVTKGTVWEQNPSLRDGDKITVGGVKQKGRERAKGAATTKGATPPPSPALRLQRERAAAKAPPSGESPADKTAALKLDMSAVPPPKNETERRIRELMERSQR